MCFSCGIPLSFCIFVYAVIVFVERRLFLSKRIYFVLAVLILLIASIVRIWDFTTLPLGLSDIEVSHIDVARDEIQRGNVRVFYEREIPDSDQVTGQEGLYHLVLAIVTLPFGMGTFSLRFISLLINMVTIATLYTLGVRLFGYKAGLITASLYAFLMYPTLLSRLALVETALPLMTAAVMLSIARAFPVYYRTRAETSNTIDYAVMGILISLSLYLHQSSLFIVLMAMAFITYILIMNRPVPLRRLSYIGFSILMLIIIAIPYFISTLRLTDLGANNRILGDYNGIITSIINSTLGLMWEGDSNLLINIANRPLMDIVTGSVAILSLFICLRKWRNPRYAFVLIAVITLAPPVILAGNAPNFLAMSVALPPILLLVSVGFTTVINGVPKRIKFITAMLVTLIIVGNLAWTVDSLFNQWADSEDVHSIYNGDIGQIAHHLDITADDIPVVVCNPEWDRVRARNQAYSDIDLLRLFMNRDTVLLHEIDCTQAFLFVNAGEHQQVVLNPREATTLLPSAADWLSLGTTVLDLPNGRVIDMQVQAELEDALGVFTTTTPASYATSADVSNRIPIAPPIRFGGNFTWLGYETDPVQEYAPDSIVPVSTYWRIEGLIPSDSVIFTHILTDPIFPIAQVDTIHIDPTELRERDIYLHSANVVLPQIVESGQQIISVGVYQSSSNERLAVFINGIPQGTRIFLYTIDINLPNDSDN